MHRDAPVPDAPDGIAGLSWVIDTNRSSMQPFAPAIFPAESVESLAADTQAALDRHGPLLAARAAAGRLRRCHGDLHLGNICLWQGVPTLFDAIEFSDRLSCIDVFYDLAFLLMDLDQRGLGELASLAMNQYLDLTGDYDGALALPLFLSLRAAVRAHVAAATGQVDRARSMLAAAQAYLSPPPPRLVAVGGLSGSGKSRLARDLAPRLGVPGAVVVRSDAVRKQIMAVGAFDRLGPEGYTPAMTARTYDRLVATCARLLAGGRAVIADAVFARADERDRIEAAAREAGIPFDGLWLDIPPDLAAERIRARRANLSDATPEVLERQRSYDTGPIAWTRIDSSAPKAATQDEAARALGV
jgi:predicted kinase